MAICRSCSMESNYTCINCGVPVCNRNSDCSSAVSEEHPGWKMGVFHCVKNALLGIAGKQNFRYHALAVGFTNIETFGIQPWDKI